MRPALHEAREWPSGARRRVEPGDVDRRDCAYVLADCADDRGTQALGALAELEPEPGGVGLAGKDEVDVELPEGLGVSAAASRSCAQSGKTKMHRKFRNLRLIILEGG